MVGDKVEKIGADIGFGYGKVVWLVGDVFKSLVVPSVIGRSARVRSLDLGMGAKKRQRVFKVTYRDEEYLVGADALLHSATGLTAVQSFGRIGSDEERILLLALLAKAGLDDVAIVTGLPVLAWDQRHALRRSWEGEHSLLLGKREVVITIHQVRTAWQPVMSLWDYALVVEDGQVRLGNGMDNDLLRRGWLIVDVGHNTTDRAGVINLTPVEQYSGGARVGGRDILAVIGKRIEEEYGVSRSLAEIEEALRRGYIDLFDERVDLFPLARSAAGSLSAEVASKVAAGIGDGSAFYAILVTGGAARVVSPAIAKACPRNRVVVLGDPQLANARGACKFAQGVFKG